MAFCYVTYEVNDQQLRYAWEIRGQITHQAAQPFFNAAHAHAAAQQPGGGHLQHGHAHMNEAQLPGVFNNGHWLWNGQAFAWVQ